MATEQSDMTLRIRKAELTQKLNRLRRQSRASFRGDPETLRGHDRQLRETKSELDAINRKLK